MFKNIKIFSLLQRNKGWKRRLLCIRTKLYNKMVFRDIIGNSDEENQKHGEWAGLPKLLNSWPK